MRDELAEYADQLAAIGRDTESEVVDDDFAWGGGCRNSRRATATAPATAAAAATDTVNMPKDLALLLFVSQLLLLSRSLLHLKLLLLHLLIVDRRVD